MRVLLVDDHALFAQSLAIVLSDFPSIEQFSNIKSVDEIEATIEREKPDILLRILVWLLFILMARVLKRT